MLVKCVCANCGHGYLADDAQGRPACPRCGTTNEATRNPSDIPEAPRGAGLEGGYGDGDIGFAFETRFDPQAPPPMYVTRERLVRGIVFGSLAALVLGAVVGAALAAIQLRLPGALGRVLALAAGGGCRYGFGGRATRRSFRRAGLALALGACVGIGGYLAGSWAVERWTGMRAEQTRADLDRGLRSLNARRAGAADEGERILLEQRIAEVQRLQGLSDAGLEDYLWMQQAGIGQPLLAYAKLRAWRGPAIRFGADSEPVELPRGTPALLLLGDALLAFFLGLRAVRPR